MVVGHVVDAAGHGFQRCPTKRDPGHILRLKKNYYGARAIYQNTGDPGAGGQAVCSIGFVERIAMCCR